MDSAPRKINGASVILFTPIDQRHRHTGRWKQIVSGDLLGPAAVLAICQYEGEANFYLFGCDAAWNSVTDTWHQTIEEAMGQAEIEYEGAAKTWQRAATPAS